MMICREFELVSSRIISHIDNITPEEFNLWIYYLERYDHTYDGDKNCIFKTDSDELHVRHWIWKDQHKIMDICFFPRDELGIISFDDIPILRVSNEVLSPIINDIDAEFRDRIELFKYIRIFLNGDIDIDDEDMADEIDVYLNSDRYVSNCKIENESRK